MRTRNMPDQVNYVSLLMVQPLDCFVLHYWGYTIHKLSSQSFRFSSETTPSRFAESLMLKRNRKLYCHFLHQFDDQSLWLCCSVLACVCAEITALKCVLSTLNKRFSKQPEWFVCRLSDDARLQSFENATHLGLLEDDRIVQVIVNMLTDGHAKPECHGAWQCFKDWSKRWWSGQEQSVRETAKQLGYAVQERSTDRGDGHTIHHSTWHLAIKCVLRQFCMNTIE